MADDEFTQDLFRFLQLLCEGHNNGEKEGGQGGEDTRRQLGGGPWDLMVQTSSSLCLYFFYSLEKRSV